MVNLLTRIIYTGISYVRHPFGVTCLNCGFLALGQHEVDSAARILLHCRGTAGCPPLEELLCLRSLWVDFNLTYSGSPPADEIFDMVQKQQRNCKGFFRYKPGWSPRDHRDLLIKSHDRWVRLAFALFGMILTLLGMWLANRLGLK
jgi:hypothetical protein